MRIRKFRLRGFLKWRVPETIALLPLLLQAALAFFSVGLVDLLWSLDPIVATVVTVFFSLSLGFVLITTLLPSVFLDAPHRSPQAYVVFRIIRTLIPAAYTYSSRAVRQLVSPKLPYFGLPTRLLLSSHGSWFSPSRYG